MTYLILLNVCTLLLRNTLCIAAQIPFRMFGTVCMWIRLLSTSQCRLVHTSMTLFLLFFILFGEFIFTYFTSSTEKFRKIIIIQIMVLCMCSARSDLLCFLCVHHYWRVDNCVESKMVEFVFYSWFGRLSSKNSLCVCICVFTRVCVVIVGGKEMKKCLISIRSWT